MHLSPPKEAPLRILGLFPHPRQTGHVVIDESGLVPGSVISCRTRRAPTLELRIAAVERLIVTSVARHRPSVIAIVRPRGCAWVETVTERAIAAAHATGLPIDLRDEQPLADLFADPATRGYDHLGQTIATTFFPELAARVPSWRRGHEDERRPLRPVWKAAAAALAALAEIRPEVIAAIARGPLPPRLAALLLHQTPPV